VQKKGKAQFVTFLLEKKADPNIRDKSAGGGVTPFEAAKRAGQKEVMALLKPSGTGTCCIIT